MMDPKIYGDDIPRDALDALPSVGDPTFGISAQNNDCYFEYDTDARTRDDGASGGAMGGS